MKLARAARPLLALALLAPAAAALLAAGAHAQTAPEPARVSPTWMLDFEHQQPRVVSYREADGHVRWFWYMPYKIVNDTGRIQSFIPDVTVAYDNGAIIDADKSIPASVYRLVHERVGNPLMKSPAEAAGDILDGPDYARESVAIWEHPDEQERGHAGEMRVFVAGISGETRAIPHPVDPEQTIVLQRARMLRYDLPGRPATPRQQPIALEETRDVMR